MSKKAPKKSRSANSLKPDLEPNREVREDDSQSDSQSETHAAAEEAQAVANETGTTETGGGETSAHWNMKWSEVSEKLDFVSEPLEPVGDLHSEDEISEMDQEMLADDGGATEVATEDSAIDANSDPAFDASSDSESVSESVSESASASDLTSEFAAAPEPSDEAGAGPVEFIETDQLVSVIESLLFSTDKPVSITTIKQIFKGSNVRTKDISLALETLASDYAAASRGVTLEEINGGYQLRTKVDNAEFLRRLAKTRPFRLSGPALEVMAIVAYKQPITKHEIDEIRGVESGHLLRALMERGLVNFAGKSELAGKPMTYGSSRKFLEIFGLRNLKELPTMREIDELIPQGIGEVEEKESLSELTDRMSNELGSTYSEGEDELTKINAELKDIDTTSDFFEQEKIRERERREKEKAQDIRERLMVGEAVEEKDKRWLDRYEAKLQAKEVAAQAGEPQVVAASEIEDETGIGDQLKSLSAEFDASDEPELSGSQSENHRKVFDSTESDENIENDADYLDAVLNTDLDAQPDWDEETKV